ncbi:1-aminocyclopropane-1-carboxylate oxidase homolog 4-like [Telopea speciosissima]|uniref:1-aminocyclopropane-1-carboxylate oxidase homolog 4-like n=1 Tax=Telopea speciosissima TaxID=54955 RepID=UPI001CC4D07E|nr:1-aminocyclopropane-1-carboxylate oxidase homolog 4-like [Telopea speciosissima]
MAISNPPREYDQVKEAKEFEDAMIGVKGLVDSGITTIPRFFIQPPKILSTIKPTNRPTTTIEIPVIDLSDINNNFSGNDARARIVEEIRGASRTRGIFYIINHGIQDFILDNMIMAAKSFHEQSTELRAQYYQGKLGSNAVFMTTYNFRVPTGATWRDSLQVNWTPNPPEFEQIPAVCREEMVVMDEHMKQLGNTLMELFSEGLGVSHERLKEYMEDRLMLTHYYPYCPQPDLTLGTHPHTDSTVLTVLLHNQIDRFQVECGKEWVHIMPLPGALLVNIGDILQVLSNDEYKSSRHRVLANSSQDPGITVAFFFLSSNISKLCCPFPELLSPEKPAIYRSFKMHEHKQARYNIQLEDEPRTALSYFKL